MLAEILDATLAERLGTAGAVAVVLGAWIAWLIKDRVRLVADRDKERQRNEDMAERLVEQAERTVPVLERNATALAEATRTIERLERDR